MDYVYAARVHFEFCGHDVIGFYTCRGEAEKKAKQYLIDTYSRWRKEAAEKVKTHGRAYAWDENKVREDTWDIVEIKLNEPFNGYDLIGDQDDD